jgi:hypothetical protein
MICFDRVVRILLGDVAGRGQQLIEHPRIRSRPVGVHVGRVWAVVERAGEEPASGREIPLLYDEDVDDLAELIDRPVQIDPVGLEYWMVDVTCGFRSPGWVMLRSDTRW